MNTTDITGTYDYERAEALNAANYILSELAEGCIDVADVPSVIARYRAKWQRILSDSVSFADFDRHFIAALRDGGVQS